MGRDSRAAGSTEHLSRRWHSSDTSPRPLPFAKLRSRSCFLPELRWSSQNPLAPRISRTVLLLRPIGRASVCSRSWQPPFLARSPPRRVREARASKLSLAWSVPPCESPLVLIRLVLVVKRNSHAQEELFPGIDYTRPGSAQPAGG